MHIRENTGLPRFVHESHTNVTLKQAGPRHN